MKTIIKSLALALSLGVLTSAATFAETNPGSGQATVATYKTGIYTTIDGKLNIALDKETVGAVDICLKTTSGNVVYSKHIGKKQSTYRARLNVSELPDGVYQVEVTNGVETTTRTITLSTQQPTAPSRLVAVN